MDRKHEKQGYLGDLHDKTLAQLQELLQRQEKLLAKQKFLDSLPDKGEKIHQFAKILREVISLKEKHENSMTFSTQDNLCHDVTAALSEHLQSLTVGSREEGTIKDPQDGENSAHNEKKFQNSYEKVIRKDHVIDKKEPFKPNRTLKIASVRELPEKFKPKSKVPDVKKHRDSSSNVIPAGVAQTFYGQETWSCDYKQHEESAIHLPAHKFEKAKMISVEDSIEIQRRQKEEIERLQGLHAAERLAERFHIKLGNYNTWVPDMEYPFRS
ncbi:hypothetical protein C0Q70_20305 [Pomacea canaliculata]|uniref:Uncharacterized protein n=1 Tax=Pomacea canaliculata TaxID=400727 RepID=A0A2T7NF68_POMCA|nr:hypothetical protein C0Q70_20305 [Pomacea canaliculata]